MTKPIEEVRGHCILQEAASEHKFELHRAVDVVANTGGVDDNGELYVWVLLVNPGWQSDERIFATVIAFVTWDTVGNIEFFESSITLFNNAGAACKYLGDAVMICGVNWAETDSLRKMTVSLMMQAIDNGWAQ